MTSINSMKYLIPFFIAVLLSSTACGKNNEPNIAATGTAPTTAGALQTTQNPPADLQSQLQQELGTALPADAEVHHYEKVSDSDLLIRSQLSLSRASFEQWISTYQLQLADFSDEKRYLLGPATGDWNPQSVATLPTAQVMFDNGTVLNLAYQDAEENRMKVFLVLHGT